MTTNGFASHVLRPSRIAIGGEISTPKLVKSFANCGSTYTTM